MFNCGKFSSLVLLLSVFEVFVAIRLPTFGHLLAIERFDIRELAELTRVV